MSEAKKSAEPIRRAPPPMTIVTGGTGWLGQALVHALSARGTRVRCLAVDPLEAAALDLISPTIETVVGDIRNPVDLDRLFDGAADATLFHAAAVIHPAKHTRTFFDVNVGGTALTLDRARRTKVRRLVYVSSNSPFGSNASPAGLFDEDSPYRPEGGYGQSKMEAELLVRRSFDAGDLETTIVRCPWFYGPGQPQRQNRFFSLIRRGLFPLFGRGANRRSLAYTDNLVQGLLLAELVEGAGGNAYWIADARPYTMSEIVEAVRSALVDAGIPTAQKTVRLPVVVSDLSAKADLILQKMGRYSAELHVLGELGRTIACSTARAAADLGYRPEIELKEGMRRSIRWCIERGEPL